ncbi:hypothetical protein Leryth_019122 [Lithospermum erythrorhizon]|nr:hypothetical protein Leryth_019122 [Lithospermum erythrorhizon]
MSREVFLLEYCFVMELLVPFILCAILRFCFVNNISSLNVKLGINEGQPTYMHIRIKNKLHLFF